MTVPGRQDTPHSLASYNAVMNYLTKREWPGRVASTYAVVAGGHHGVPPTSGQLARSPDRSHYGGPEWAVARDELLDHISRIVGAESFIAQGWKRMPLTPQQQALWTGFVIMADWIASSDLFPLGIRDESVSTAARAWSALELPPPWQPGAAADPGRTDAGAFRSPARSGAETSVQRAVVGSRVVDAGTRHADHRGTDGDRKDRGRSCGIGTPRCQVRAKGECSWRCRPWPPPMRCSQGCCTG